MPFQFTLLVPPLTTNGIDFYKTTNDISINTFLGVSAGTDMLEAGGFANIDLYYAKGVQAAGFANITGVLGHETTSEGVQAAGFANICGTKYTGVQASGFANISKEFTGLQGAGFMNVTDYASDAFQASGFANVALETDNVFQAAGFANVALSGKSKSQVSGFGNIANEVEGVQAAGFINIARKVKGVQLSGFINICDSIDGVAIAFINLVKENGYRSFEFSMNEWTPAQLTFKMGTKDFYNIYSLSKLPMNWDRYAFGFGFGHAFRMSEGTELDVELVNHSVFSIAVPENWNYNYTNNNNLLQLKPTFKRYIGDKVALNFGPTFNFNYGYYRYSGQTTMTSGIQPYWKLFGGSQNPSRLWVGFSAGISIN